MEYERDAGYLRLDTCGMEKCAPGHRHGPAVRAYYLIHYVFSGHGVFMADGKRYDLHTGQGFVIFPGVVTTYQADESTPWHYGWLGFSGSDAGRLIQQAGLTREYPVFTSEHGEEIRSIIAATVHDVASLRLGALSAAGGVMRFLAHIAQPTAESSASDALADQYFRKAAWYIEGHLESGVSVAEVASFVGLCRSQLFRVFRASAGCSPQAWMLNARMRRAEQLLTGSLLSLNEIARSCGFAGAAQLSQSFRRARGMSPSAYRRQQRANEPL